MPLSTFLQKAKEITPQKIVEELNKHIIGQHKAKRAVAIALRNRFRRMQLKEDFRNEVSPKNILMIGPTGVGKTEIARRLAKLANAPFIKVEATKFTEIGFVGRDVESIIRDLMEVSIKLAKEQALNAVDNKSLLAAENRILDVILPQPKHMSEFESNQSQSYSHNNQSQNQDKNQIKSQNGDDDSETRQLFRKKLREGELDDKEIELEMSHSSIGVEIMAPPGMEEMTSQLQSMFQSISGDKKKLRKLKVKDALKQLQDEEASKLINDDDVKTKAIEAAEQNGIVFIDEIDKVTQRSDRTSGADVSREGVQRDLLPLIEGCTVSTKYGMVKTDHILFITSGAFHISKPSDLIPELQGRLPIRVELTALQTEDFIRILTEPYASLTEQYKALLNTEGLDINFTTDGIKRIAEIAWEVNEKTENIGARRLHTVVERLLEDISFRATEMQGETVTIDEAYVNKQLNDLCQDEDLRRFIL